MDPFEVLGLQWGQCTEIDVIKTYRKLALENHPDKAGPEGEERMKSINNARDTILAKKLCSLPPPDEKPPESERQRRKKGPHSDPKPSKTKKPQPSQQQLEEQFWSRMPFLVGKIWGFVLETQPVRNESTHMPWHSMRSLYNSITSKLTAPDGSVDLERICSLIGSLFFAIKQLKIWNSNTFQEVCRIDSHWSLRYTMSTFGWCKYEGAKPDGSDSIVMDEWLLACMPFIERQWRKEANSSSLERIWETRKWDRFV